MRDPDCIPPSQAANLVAQLFEQPIISTVVSNVLFATKFDAPPPPVFFWAI